MFVILRRLLCQGRMKFISQKEAIAIDKELVERYKFGIPQLMELAGLSVSHAVFDCYPRDRFPKVLVCAGPGNNGGDGLVVARNLKLMQYEVEVFLPRDGATELLRSLTAQIPQYDIPIFREEMIFSERIAAGRYDLVIDAFFGFSFKPPLRPPFDSLVRTLSTYSKPLVSIDVPSGWLVDWERNETDMESAICIKPETIVCLSAPKACIRAFTGKNLYLGGRFLPPLLIQQHELDTPNFPDDKTFVRIRVESSPPA